MAEIGSGQSEGPRDPKWPVAPDFPTDLFAGTARDYAHYRERYPERLIDDLLRRAGTGKRRLLDLACGTGQIAMPMSPFFQEIWAVDQEPEMIGVGREEAQRAAITNIRWMAGRAEDLNVSDEFFDMIAIGNAFHRLDRRLVARRAMSWLPSGACLVVMGSGTAGKEEWRKIARRIVRRWTAKDRSDEETKQAPPQQMLTHQEVLESAGFSVDTYEFPTQFTWTLDSFIGRLYSASQTSRKALGDQASEFESEIRQTLLAHDPRGRYDEEIEFFYILARKP